MTEGSIPEWVKYAGGAVITFLAFLPVFKFRIKRVEDDLVKVKEEAVQTTALTSAIVLLTKAVTEQSESNMQVKSALFEMKRIYERVEKYEAKNSEEHKEIRENWVHNTTCKTLMDTKD